MVRSAWNVLPINAPYQGQSTGRPLIDRINKNALTRATNLAALYDTFTNPPTSQRFAYDLAGTGGGTQMAQTKVAGTSSTTSGPAQPVASTSPASGTQGAPPLPTLTSIQQTIVTVNNLLMRGFIINGTSAHNTEVRLYASQYGTAFQMFVEQQALQSDGSFSFQIPGDSVYEFLVKAVFVSSNSESAPVPVYPLPFGEIIRTEGRCLPVPRIELVTPTVFSLHNVLVNGWTIEGTSEPGTVVRLYAGPKDEECKPVFMLEEMLQPNNTFVFKVPAGTQAHEFFVTARYIDDYFESPRSEPIKLRRRQILGSMAAAEFAESAWPVIPYGVLFELFELLRPIKITSDVIRRLRKELSRRNMDTDFSRQHLEKAHRLWKSCRDEMERPELGTLVVEDENEDDEEHHDEEHHDEERHEKHHDEERHEKHHDVEHHEKHPSRKDLQKSFKELEGRISNKSTRPRIVNKYLEEHDFERISATEINEAYEEHRG